MIVGLGFVALVALAVWQTLRAGDRADRIALAEARLGLSETVLPDRPDPARHELLPVRVTGRFDPDAVQHVLHSTPLLGPGIRMIVPFDLADGGRILVDRGFVPFRILDAGLSPEPDDREVEIRGALVWPRERGRFTPDRDPETGMWFARDVVAQAAAAGAEPVMIAARDSGPGGWPRAESPAPDGTNRHVEYALTWAALAGAWLIIGVLLIRRERVREIEATRGGADHCNS